MLSVVLGGAPFFVALNLSSGANRVVDDFWTPIRAIGMWAEPAFSSGFDALAIFATVVVAVAAITGFSGDWSSLTPRAHSLFSALTAMAVAILLGMATVTPSVVAASPDSSSRTILLWLAAWAVMLVTLAVSEVRSFRSQVVLARLRALRAEQRVQHIGYDLPPRDAPTPARPLGSLVMLLGIPTILWLAFSAWVGASMNVPVSVAVLFTTLGFGGLIGLIVWTAGSDATAPPPASTFVRGGVIAGMVITVAFAISVFAFSTPIGAGLIVMTCASALLLLPLSVSRRIPVLRTVQEWQTFRSLRLVRTRSDDMREQWASARRTQRTPRPPRWKRVLRDLLD